MMTLGLLMSGTAIAPPPAFSYRDSYLSTADQSNYSFTNCDIGTAHVKRLVVVGVIAISGQSSAVTVGGISASLVVDSDPGDDAGCQIWQALVPTGATATIAVSVVSATSCIIHVYAGYPANPTAVGSFGQITEGGNDGLATDVAKTAGGFLIMIGHTQGNRTFVFSTTGAETFTENFDGLIEGADNSGAASFIATATTTTDDMIYTLNGNSNHNSATASWGPP